VIENVFGSLKNMWCPLRNFNSKVDRATRINIACCWLHNYRELWNLPKLGGREVRCRGPLQGFRNVKLSVIFVKGSGLKQRVRV